MAMQSQASKCFSRNAKPLLGLLLLFSFSSYGACQDISMSCPTKLNHNSITQVNCFIYSTIVLPFSCSLSASVEFYFVNSSVTTRLCHTPYYGPVVLEVVGDMNCAMVTSSSEVRTFQLNFQGDRASHEGGKLTCRISCTQNFLTTSSQPCGPLTFTEPESTCNISCKVGIGVGVLLACIIFGGYTAKRKLVRVTTLVEVIE